MEAVMSMQPSEATSVDGQTYCRTVSADGGSATVLRRAWPPEQGDTARLNPTAARTNSSRSASVESYASTAADL